MKTQMENEKKLQKFDDEERWILLVLEVYWEY